MVFNFLIERRSIFYKIEVFENYCLLSSLSIFEPMIFRFGIGMLDIL